MGKILIIGGTTEGRAAVEVCEEGGKPFLYSTLGTSQEVALHHGTRLEGPLDADAMTALCRREEVSVLVDAAHPFATIVHRNVAKAATEVALPTVRYERVFPPLPEGTLSVSSFPEAMRELERLSPRRLLALTGVKSIAAMGDYPLRHEVWLRVMPIPETERVVSESDFPRNRLIYYDRAQDDRALMERLRPDLLLLKESGESSGFEEKVKAATDLGIPILVIRRPTLGYRPTETVLGPVGLRRALERLDPDFFPLRIGFTTGTTATAATTAALLALLNDETYTEVPVRLLTGEEIRFPISETCIESEECATATAIKYSGDDPDVTSGTAILSTVRLTDSHTGVTFHGGKGVGRITLPGIGLPIGDPAINPGPRQMMTEAVGRLVDLSRVGIDITITVPQGETLAPHTFNPRLGVVDGISILGTTGVLRPFSTEAWVDSIRREMGVSRSVFGEHLVINSGGKSERWLRAHFPDLPPNAFVQYGNFIGRCLEMARAMDFDHITLGIMIGKAVKLAEGQLDTHSKKSVMSKPFIRSLGRESGLDEATLDRIDGITMAGEIWEILPDHAHPFYHILLDRCYTVCKPLVPGIRLDMILIDKEGGLIERNVEDKNKRNHV